VWLAPGALAGVTVALVALAVPSGGGMNTGELEI